MPGADNALAESKMVSGKEEPIKAFMLKGLRKVPGLRSLFDLKETTLNLSPRRIYHNLEIPLEELNPKTKIPKARYATNKIRTTKYTPLNFAPKNILFQFENVANIYFLVIAILSGFSIFGVNDAGLASVPIIAIVAITALRDAIEDYRRQVLDLELNNTVAVVLSGIENPNSPVNNVSLWRRFKKACSRFYRRTWYSMRGKEDPLRLQPMESVRSIDDVRYSQDGPRFSMDTWRPSDGPRGSLDRPRGSLDRPRGSLEGARPSRDGPRFSLDTARPSRDGRRPSAAWESTFGRRSMDTSKSKNEIKFKKTYWKNVKVGDFVKIYADEGVPADVVVVSSSDSDGECFIDTRSLDGESSLKPRTALRSTRHLRKARDVANAEFWVEVEGASSRLGSFGWTMHHHPDSGIDPEPLGPDNFIPRGSTVRNTKWVLGYVVYTGIETKIMLNAGETPTKRSRITRDLNMYVVFSFVVLFVLSFISGLVEGLKFNSKTNSWRFFEWGLTAHNTALTGFVDFFAALILLQNIIPISLYISIEIVRTIQAFFIWSDVYMYDEILDYPCTPKSWGIGDDLGQVEYVFSDKTGTLTQNRMVFRKLTVGGKTYGIAFTESMEGAVKRTRAGDLDAERANAYAKIAEEREQMLIKMRDTYVNPYIPVGEEPELVSADAIADVAGQAGLQQQEAFEQFALCLALCNTVSVERSRSSDGSKKRIVKFNADSPDESALVKAARDLGYTLVNSDKSSKTVDMRGIFHKFRILGMLAFTSARKRMSLLVRNEVGRTFVLVKGADSVILERLSSESRNSEMCKNTEKHMEEYANDGLRVLLLGYREVSTDFAASWMKSYEHALASPERETLLERVGDELETNLTLLGGTGIEDLLQVGVPDTIHTLGRAGIKLWVLTGDKIETAISIGFACNLLEAGMELLVVRTVKELEEAMTTVGVEYSAAAMKEASLDHSPASGNFALVVDGGLLSEVMGDATLQAEFALLGKKCRSVLCCRVSPSQKAAIVHTIKSAFDVTTLAIGDGANDVSMIQVADIGVGIAGVEGRQAAMSADYAIGQFRFLKRLLLVHGRYSYRRIAGMTTNLLYKNFVFTIVLFWYSIFSQFDESYYFDYTYVTLFSSVFTSLPAVFMGILDQDLPAEVLLEYPQLYKSGILRESFSTTRFFLYVIDGTYQSAVSFFFAYFVFWRARFNTLNGLDISSRQFVGTFSAHVAVFCCNFYVILNQYRWDWVSVSIFVLSNALIIAWTGIYTVFIASNFFYDAAYEVYGSLDFWAMVLVGLVAAMLPFMCYKCIQAMWFPTDVDIVREWYHSKAYQKLRQQQKEENPEGQALSAPPLGEKHSPDPDSTRDNKQQVGQ